MRTTSCAKGLAIELRRARMVVAVARELVPVANHPLDQFRVALRDPAEHEERGVHVVLGEQIQHAPGVARDPRGQLLPVAALDLPLEGRDLEILLDIDRHRIARPVRRKALVLEQQVAGASCPSSASTGVRTCSSA